MGESKLDRRTFLKVGATAAAALAIKGMEPLTAWAGNGTNNEVAIEELMKDPSNYPVHMLRKTAGIGDINLSEIRNLNVILTDLGADSTTALSSLSASVKASTDRSQQFWSRALDSKSQFTNVPGIPILPSLFPDQAININQCLDQVTAHLTTHASQFGDFVPRFQEIIEDRQTGFFRPTSKSFSHLTLFVVSSSSKIDPQRLFQNSSKVGQTSAEIGITFVPITPSALLNWTDNKIDTLVAHEQGHSILNLPEQYDPVLSPQWYDTDPLNIMGPNMWVPRLDEMHLATSTKQWILNKKKA